jgi:hypothetical protein
MQHQHQQTQRPVLALCFGAAAGALQRPFLSASPATVYYMNTAPMLLFPTAEFY